MSRSAFAARFALSGATTPEPGALADNGSLAPGVVLQKLSVHRAGRSNRRARHDDDG